MNTSTILRGAVNGKFFDKISNEEIMKKCREVWGQLVGKYFVMFKSQSSAVLRSKLRLQRNVRYAVISIYFLLLYNNFLHSIRIFNLLTYSLPHPQSIRNHQLSFAKFVDCHITKFEQFLCIHPMHCFPSHTHPRFLVSPATSGVLPFFILYLVFT